MLIPDIETFEERAAIVQYDGGLSRVMAEASEAVVGRPLPVSASGVGLDEVEPGQRDDLKRWRDERVDRTAGYQARLAAWRGLRAATGVKEEP